MDGMGTLEFQVHHLGPPTNGYSIVACGFDPLTVESLTITISSETVLVDSSTWDTVKALYR